MNFHLLELALHNLALQNRVLPDRLERHHRQLSVLDFRRGNIHFVVTPGPLSDGLEGHVIGRIPAGCLVWESTSYHSTGSKDVQLQKQQDCDQHISWFHSIGDIKSRASSELKNVVAAKDVATGSRSSSAIGVGSTD